MKKITSRSNNRGQGLESSKRVVVDAVADSGTVLVAADQPRILEDSEVLGNRRLGQGKFSNYLTANPRLFPRQHAENTHPGRVTDGLCQFGEFFVRLGTFQSPQIGLPRLLDFRAAERVRIGLLFNSHSSINDSTMGNCGQAPSNSRSFTATVPMRSSVTGVLPFSMPRSLTRRWMTVSYTHLRAHETRHDLVCRLL